MIGTKNGLNCAIWFTSMSMNSENCSRHPVILMCRCFEIMSKVGYVELVQKELNAQARLTFYKQTY